MIWKTGCGMNRILSVLTILGVLSVPAVADDLGVPAGVLIYDVTPAAPVLNTPSPTMVAPPPAQPVIGAAETTFTLSADPAPTVLAPLQSKASVRSVPQAAPVVNGTALDPASVAAEVNLAPGETVVQAIAVSPAIVQIPNPQPVYTSRYEPSPQARVAPTPKRDPLTGRLRDTPGWTGRREAPASIGCYPAGACAVLNAR